MQRSPFFVDVSMFAVAKRPGGPFKWESQPGPRFHMSEPLRLIVGSCLHEGEPNKQDVWGCEVGVCYVKAMLNLEG